MVQVVYMCSSFLQFTVESRDFFKAEKRVTIALCKAEQIHKVTTIFTQNDNFVHPGQFCVSFYESAHLYITVILFSG